MSTNSSFSLFATCPKGTEKVLLQDLLALGITPGREDIAGIAFEGGFREIYLTNLCLRSAIRVLRVLVEGDASNEQALYDLAFSIPWQNIFSLEQTFMVDSNVRDSNLTHSQFVSQKIKDAICDQFKQNVGARPSVDKEHPHIKINFHLSCNHGIISLDSSGESLHKRGYRPKQWKAPLNEALAASIIKLAEWKPPEPFWDPMCGSGTIPVEAAMISMARPPGLTRKYFGFQGWRDFDQSLYYSLRDSLRQQMVRVPETWIRGSDQRGDSMFASRENARAAGIGHAVEFCKEAFSSIRPPANLPPGLMILNPPYGVRLGTNSEVVQIHREIGQIARQYFPGWRWAVLTGFPHAQHELKVEPKQVFRLWNGPIPCKLIVFQS
ncbi:MAG: RNA methyltransferase [Gemmataceae bacterium]|nr:RNA methyltransferase [Gemmataceae bacterium]